MPVGLCEKSENLTVVLPAVHVRFVTTPEFALTVPSVIVDAGTQARSAAKLVE
jgi:hypothetical protein